jgi:CheY-like chemotaxis protein
VATPTAGSAKTILLIDDQPFFLTLQQSMLQRHGYRVLAASDGPEGLAMAKQHKPDLILLDIEMPGMDGFTVCETLKQDRALRKIPVIILTQTQAPKLNEKAFRAGAEITILKSVAGERLLNVLRIALDRIKP